MAADAAFLQGLRSVTSECQARCLYVAAKWATEQLVSVPSSIRQSLAPSIVGNDPNLTELDEISFAQSLFHCKEFQRTAESLRECRTNLAVFLRFYSLYLASEKRSEDSAVDLQSEETVINPELSTILRDFEPYCRDAGADAYLFHLQGVLLRKLGRQREAIDSLVRSATLQPYHWGTWLELANCCSNVEQVTSLLPRLPNHKMTIMFQAQALVELNQGEEAGKLVEQPISKLLPNSPHVIAQRAFCLYMQQKMDEADVVYDNLFKEHPLRLEQVDVFSNILYVRDHRARLANLAQRVIQIDRYRPETCCVVGNYYSKKGLHDKAVQYFQRALRLSPSFSASWTLMGHEYLEIKNIHAAIACYRRASDLNSHDYRAWYSLGQAYEFLRLPLYSLYYYRKAAALRPYDTRMWRALGSCYELLERRTDAAYCYERGIDGEGAALLALGRLHHKLEDSTKAASFFQQYLQLLEGTVMDAPQAEAALFVGRFYASQQNIEAATKWLTKALDVPGPDADAAKSELRALRSGVVVQRN